MRLLYSEHFLEAYQSAPPRVQKAFNKQIELLLHDLRHPSLRAKKYDEARNIWQARVNRDWRFYFTIEHEAYHLHDNNAASEVSRSAGTRASCLWFIAYRSRPAASWLLP